jgi:hypothetical protein
MRNGEQSMEDRTANLLPGGKLATTCATVEALAKPEGRPIIKVVYVDGRRFLAIEHELDNRIWACFASDQIAKLDREAVYWSNKGQFAEVPTDGTTITLRDGTRYIVMGSPELIVDHMKTPAPQSAAWSGASKESLWPHD